MKIGIITFFTNNYGALLQCFALQYTLHNLGHDTAVINRNWGDFQPKSSFFSQFKNWVFYNPFNEFRNKHIKFTKQICNKNDLHHVTKEFDMIIVGSDQVWNADCISTMGLYYYLDWCPDKIKKVSYAVSFGKDSFNTSASNIKTISTILQKYEKISVRELSGINICKTLFNINAKQTLDPTLLLTSSEYDKMIGLYNKRKNFICQYFLDSSKEKELLAINIANIFKIPIYNNYPNHIKKYKRIIFMTNRYLSVKEWLSNIKNASYIITDSFHGVVFSIIFHKQFVCINNKKRGATRFKSLLSILKLEDRLVDEEFASIELVKKILKNPIDYTKIENILTIERHNSFNYLTNL